MGAKRVFASAVDWPGWSRSGRDEAGAQQALLDYAARYAAVPRKARIRFAAPSRCVVIESLAGDATTDFGAPSRPAALEAEALDARATTRLSALLAAAWTVFDDAAGAAPPTLRKGPRGGGRDRDAMVEHVLAAEHAYARKIGVRSAQPQRGDRSAIMATRNAVREAITAAARHPESADLAWPARYAARRIAWHALDHAWEMEDRAGQ